MVGSGKAREKADPGPGSAEWSDTLPGLQCGENIQTERESLGCPVGDEGIYKDGVEQLPSGKRAGVSGDGGKGDPGLWPEDLRRKGTLEEPWSPSTRFHSLGSRALLPASLDTLLSSSLKQNVHTDTASWRGENIHDIHITHVPHRLGPG